MNSLSCETIVGEKLVSWLIQYADAQILSFHPPSSKAYSSDLIRIPKISTVGEHSRDRNHIDVIFITTNSLWLVELKCKSSESDDDVKKLLDIRNTYTQQQLIELIKSRVTVPLKYDMAKIKEVVIAIGVKKNDTTSEINIPVFIVDDDVQLVGFPIHQLLKG